VGVDIRTGNLITKLEKSKKQSIGKLGNLIVERQRRNTPLSKNTLSTRPVGLDVDGVL
jgi:hypothetical protein